MTETMTLPAAKTELVDDLTDLCQSAGRDISFGRWPRPLVRSYVAFHLAHGTLNFEQIGGEVRGVLFAWRGLEADLRDRARRQLPVFDWQAGRPDGDCIIVAQAIAIAPGVLARLIAQAAVRFPDWRQLKLFTFRHGWLLEYPHRIVEHITKGDLC